MLFAHSPADTQIFTAGQHSHENAHGQAKYEKYVYSSAFAFPIAKEDVLLKQCAVDSTLAVSESENFWRTAYGYSPWAIHPDYTYSQWKPWDDVTIDTFVIPRLT